MRTAKSNHPFLITVSFLIAIVLTLLPLPEWAIWIRPQWVLSLLIYWILAAPDRCNIGFSFTIGLFLDILTGTPLGLQAFVFVLFAFFVLHYQRAIARFSVWQKACVAGVFAMINALVQGWLLVWLDHGAFHLLYVLSAVTTCLVWPFFSIILDRLRPRVLIHV